ncbi:VOC family protein [Rufibacter immobilis]|uniref:VOC family protein n=2 Tax=Rufibacter immobilis TaxID=1348778 RepID=UPI001C83CD17|nr:hypothetical protein [Rufibacter immobilis]
MVTYWGVEDIQSTYGELIQLGATENEKPYNVGGELMTSTVKDPWGNLIGIIYNPEFTLNQLCLGATFPRIALNSSQQSLQPTLCNMKNQIDIKSLLIGFLSAALIIMAFSFKNSTTGQGGRFQAETSETGVIVLDVETGAYIINTDMTNNKWRKGDFQTTHKVSKDNLQE